MKNQLRTALMALIFWLVFGIGVLATLVGQLFGIAVYALTGNEVVRAWVYRTGKGMDGVNNAAWFGGNAKEVISSHAGRWLRDTSGRPVPWRFRFVILITDLFEKNHTIKAIEEPFKDEPL